MTASPAPAPVVEDPAVLGPTEDHLGRPLLRPGTPVPFLGWVRGSTRVRSLPIPVWLRVTLTVAATLALGTWGFLELPSHLSALRALYSAIKLYTLDLGPAGGTSAGPDWQIWLALVAAAGLVLRGVVALARDRVRRGAVAHLLSAHVIVCGAGVHGTRLARTLSAHHDVVLVDSDAVSPGMQELRGRYEWRLIGDAVSERTLRAAGIRRAHWLIAVTGNDFVNSQIVSGVRTLVKHKAALDRVRVLVQIEDPALARFLEEDDGSAEPPAAEGPQTPATTGDGPIPRPVVSPFSTNAIAASVLLDESKIRDDAHPGAPLAAMQAGTAPNLLLVGDHPLLDAIVLEALRRWRVSRLRCQESEAKTGSPIHLSVYGPGAERRVTQLREAWRPEPEVMSLEARDSPPAGEPGQLDDWLSRKGRGDHAIVACNEELDGIALTLAVARALGDHALMTRVTTQFENALDAYVEERTANSLVLATTDVKSIAELGARTQRMSEPSGVHRLIDALVADADERANEGADASGDGEEAAGTGGEAEAAGPKRRDPDPVARARAVFESLELRVRADTTWRVRPGERPLLTALLDTDPRLEPVPLSAIVHAGLRVDLDADRLLRAAGKLTERGNPTALTAWCEYLRHAPAALGLDRDALAVALTTTKDPAVAQLLELITSPPEPDPNGLFAGAGHVTIFAGAAGSMSALARREITALLDRALEHYDGALLSGGTAVGMPGLIGTVARQRNLRLVGYVPLGKGDVGLYRELRHTPRTSDFSVLEPLAMWRDIAASGVPFEDVTLIASPGKTITWQEISLARALGARVGYIDPSGEAERPLEEELPLGAAGVVELPADAMTIRAFLAPSRLDEPLRSAIARYVHNDYRRRQRKRKTYGDPALSTWEELPQSLRDSNLAQADDIPNKLAFVNKRVEHNGELLTLAPEDVERLAEVEHGRWTAERLAGGWRLGPRQVGRSTSPDLVPWDELPDAIREYDREAVGTMVLALADAGWGVSAAPPGQAPGGAPSSLEPLTAPSAEE